jgi:hypothetical protein
MFAFQNLVQDYVVLGKKREPEENELFRRILQVHFKDLADTADFYGQVLSKRVRVGNIQLDRIKEIQNRFRRNTEKMLLDS